MLGLEAEDLVVPSYFLPAIVNDRWTQSSFPFVKADLAFGNQEVNFDPDPFLETTVKGTYFHAQNGNRDPDLLSIGIKIADDLFVCITRSEIDLESEHY